MSGYYSGIMTGYYSGIMSGYYNHIMSGNFSRIVSGYYNHFMYGYYSRWRCAWLRPQIFGRKTCSQIVVQDVPGSSPVYLVMLGGSADARGPYAKKCDTSIPIWDILVYVKKLGWHLQTIFDNIWFAKMRNCLAVWSYYQVDFRQHLWNNCACEEENNCENAVNKKILVFSSWNSCAPTVAVKTITRKSIF